ncbi:MAG: EamA family transporter [Acidobacteria bacterium]|nr:EamA family transporter [Acidobacteriota bacterium]
MKHEKTLAYIAFFTVCTVWGTTYLAIRVAIETLPVILFPGVRFTIAGVVLMVIRLAMGDRLPRRRSDWANLTLIGFLMVGVGNLSVVWAEQFVTSGFAALLVGTAPFWMAAMESHREGGPAIEKRRVAGMLVGFAGVIVLVLPELMGSRFDRNFLLGVIGIQLATIAWNFGSLRSKYHPPQTSTLMSAARNRRDGRDLRWSRAGSDGEGPHDGPASRCPRDPAGRGARGLSGEVYRADHFVISPRPASDP